MGTSHDMEFEKVVEGFLSYWLKTAPVTATWLGVHAYDEELTDFSPKALAEREKKVETYKKSFKAINKRNLSASNRVDLELILSRLELEEMFLSTKKYPLFQLSPNLYLQELLLGVYGLLGRSFAPLRERALSLTRRLAQTGAFLKQAKQNLLAPPDVFLETALATIAGATRYLDEAVGEFAKDIHGALKEALLEAKDDAIAELKVFEIFLRELQGLKQKSAFPLGKPAYDQLLKLEHHVSYSSGQLLELANTEITKLEKELDVLAASIAKKKPWREQVLELEKIHPTPASLLAAYRKEAKSLRQFVVDKDGLTLPLNDDIEVQVTPAFAAPIFPFIGYVPPVGGDSMSRGIFWVTIPAAGADQDDKLRAHPLAGLALRASYETYPGRHVQQVACAGQSLLRQLFRSNLTTAGWSFYSAEWVREQGYLADPKQKLLALRDALWRAYRVQLDASLQCKTVTVKGAISTLIEKVGLEPSLAEAEVRRYCQMPGEAMGYLLGRQEIRALRDDYLKRGGKSASLKAFHDEFLALSALPVPKIRQLMEL